MPGKQIEKSGILKLLSKAYPSPKSELRFKNRYQLFVSVALSAQCTDKKVNQITPALFAKYPNFKTLAQARLKDVEKIIREINYYKTKSNNIIRASVIVSEKHRGRLPETFENLTALPGVGRKTANVILTELGIENTMPVDTHVFRVSQRLGLAKGNSPEAIEEQLKKAFKPKDWRNLHHCLILHGRRICKARNPLCGECTLNKICPSKK